MQVIPAVDVLNGQVVRLARGSYDDVTRYGSDPAAQIQAWAALGARLVHVVDLEAARSGRRDVKLLQSLGDTGVAFQFGGGIRTAGDAALAIAAGASRVVVGTAAVWDPAALTAILEAVGHADVVAALDVALGHARGVGWQDEGAPVEEVVERLVSQGVQRALVTGIASDGMMSGPDLDLLARMRAAAPGFVLIGSGGVGSIADLIALRDAGAEGAIVGRALYEHRFTLPEAIEALA